MINFYDGEIKDILPSNLMEDPAAQAFSYALRKGTRLLNRYTQLCYVYCSIDTAPNDVVDLLAKELRTQYYSDALELDVKRGLVRNTLIWYMTAGTPAAVEELVGIVFGEGEVSEWFEYGGKPYWFKIKTNAILTEDMNTFFSDMIRRVKNTRSHIEAIEIHRTIEQTIYAGACCAPQYRPAAIIDGYSVEREAEQTIYAASASDQQYRPAAIIDGYEEARAAHGTIHAGTAEASQTRQEAVREALMFEGKEIHAEALRTGTAAAQTTRPAAIIDGGTQEAAAAAGTIYVGTAISSNIQKTTIKEGGQDDATTIQ